MTGKKAVILLVLIFVLLIFLFIAAPYAFVWFIFHGQPTTR